MSEKDRELFDRLLKERAERLQISEGMAKQGLKEKPLFVTSAESRALSKKLPASRVLAHDAKRLEKQSDYPTPDCLNPSEIERYVTTAQLSDEARYHLDNCVQCESLLSTLKPSQEGFSRFVAQMRRHFTPMG